MRNRYRHRTFPLRRSRSAAQLNVGKRRISKGSTERYEGLKRSPSKAPYALSPQSRGAPTRSPSEGYQAAERRPTACGAKAKNPGKASMRLSQALMLT
jgi:hypothetical protein